MSWLPEAPVRKNRGVGKMTGMERRKMGEFLGVRVMNSRWRARLACALFVVIPLSGCVNSDFSDLDAYISKVKSRPAGRIEPVPEFQTYETYTYSASKLRDPFESANNESDIVENEIVSNGLRPDVNRNKETLEQYPLDTLSFVGHLEKDGERWAIITSPDDLVHRVKAGNHVGTNYGEIITISETKIQIKEIVQDGMGGWIEREAGLSLKE
jgi:type IV pilus assembly protein PilP